jgi:hypothetical protein
MQTKTTVVVALVLPLLLLACDRAEQSPTAAIPGQEKQAMTPDKTLERSPPAAGMPAAPASESATTTPAPQPAIPLPDNAAQATQPNEAKKAY